MTNNWLDKPNEEGDWLWVQLWSCGCCICKHGMAFVRDYPAYDRDQELSKTNNIMTINKDMYVIASTEYNPSEGLDIFWKKIDFPKIK